MGEPAGMILLIVMVLGFTGGQDSLDAMPTETYWQHKAVVITVENMVAELGGEVAAPEPETDQAKEAAHIAALIEKLGADAYADREAAQKELEEIGPPAMAALEKATESEDPEVAVRAGRVVDGLRRQAAAAAGVPGQRRRRPDGPQAKAIRRLMAIRTIGERKFEAAMPTLRKLTDSKTPFEAEYAARAIAVIEGKEFKIEQPEMAAREKDLAALPQNMMAVGQISFRPGEGLARLMDGLTPPPVNPEAWFSIRSMMVESVIGSLEFWGNVRLNHVTVFVPDDVGDNSGYAGFVLHGKWDMAAVKAAAGNAGGEKREVAGVNVWDGPHTIMASLSDSQMMFFTRPEGVNPPVDAIIKAIKAGEPGGIEKNEPMQALLKTVDQKATVWGAMLPNKDMQAVPVLAPVRGLIGQMTFEGQGFEAMLKATGEEGEQVMQSGRLAQSGYQMAMLQGRKEAPAAMGEFINLLMKAKFEMADGASTVALEADDRQALPNLIKALLMGQLD